MPPATPPATRRVFLATALAALGVVYGDIGTSPLYALKECFAPEYGLAPTARQRAGRPVADLLVAQLRGLAQVPDLHHAGRQPRRGRHHGAPRAAASRGAQRAGARRLLVGLGLFGAALLYGDGVITPAISVLGAVEGLSVAAPGLPTWVVPILSSVILVALFLFQRRGTAQGRRRLRPGDARLVRVDRAARARRHRAAPGGPGGGQSVARGRVLPARRRCAASWSSAPSCWWSPAARRCTPTWATSASGRSGWPGSRSCCRRCCSTTSARARCCSTNPAAARQSVLLAGAGLGRSIPMVAVATAAAVVASQALISGAFSLTRQAVQLGLQSRG